LEGFANANFRRLALLVALVGMLHGLAWIPLVDPHTATDSDTYVATAGALLGGGYSTPLRAGFYYVFPVGFFDITGVHVADRSLFSVRERQAFRPPGYPLFLALVGGGDAGVSRTLALGGQAVLFGIGVVLLALTVRRWWGPSLGLGAAALYALDPYSKHYVTLILTEALAGALVCAAAYAVTRAWQQRAPAWWAVAGGLAAGLTLVRAVFVLAVPLVLLAALVRGRIHGAAAGLVAAAVLLVPWLVWTASVTGKPVLANYGEGFNLLVAAHGEGLGRPFEEVTADPAFVRDFERPHPSFPSAAELRSDPEAHPRYVREADETLRAAARAEYRRRLAEEPLEVAWETVYRMGFLWSAHRDWYQPERDWLRSLLAAVDWLALLLAALGAAVVLRRGGAARGIALFLLAYTAVLGVHHVEARFAMPVRGLMLAFVVLALSELAPAIRTRRRA
jgi:4-amino-4-deoxy-L-arabinose transferase-like glycosyltransferase